MNLLEIIKEKVDNPTKRPKYNIKIVKYNTIIFPKIKIKFTQIGPDKWIFSKYQYKNKQIIKINTIEANKQINLFKRNGLKWYRIGPKD